jgi:hypothetical protein
VKARINHLGTFKIYFLSPPELLNLNHSKFSIQFIGTSEDYFMDDNSTLATTRQNKFKKALKELALQLNAKIS